MNSSTLRTVARWLDQQAQDVDLRIAVRIALLPPRKSSQRLAKLLERQAYNQSQPLRDASTTIFRNLHKFK